MVKVRRPTQAGTFYEDTAKTLREQIERCFLHEFGPGSLPKVAEAGPRQIVGLICPHAGYMYSGPIAANSYYKLALDGKPGTVVLLGPNHTGYGSGLAVMNEGSWNTPFGNVEIDGELANIIAHGAEIIDIDETAHTTEHSIEVQLPFLQYLYNSKFKIVPICFLMQDLSSAREVGRSIAKAVAGKNVVIIASSDMTHYEPQENASKKDRLALEAVETLDETKLYSTIESYGITACGCGPIAALIVASKVLGVKEAKLLCYKTSGDVIGDYSSVVGYAAMSFTK